MTVLRPPFVADIVGLPRKYAGIASEVSKKIMKANPTAAPCLTKASKQRALPMRTTAAQPHDTATNERLTLLLYTLPRGSK
jgi:hypothetical protein